MTYFDSNADRVMTPAIFDTKDLEKEVKELMKTTEHAGFAAKGRLEENQRLAKKVREAIDAGMLDGAAHLIDGVKLKKTLFGEEK